MKRSLIIFGAYGALGSGVKDVLISRAYYDDIFLCDFNADKHESPGKNVVNVPMKDLSVEKNVIEVFNKLKIKPGGEVFLFSTVGGFLGGNTLQDTSAEDLDRMLNINLKSNFLIAKHFGILSDNQGGAICLTSALTGFNPEKGKIAYGSSKSALNYLIRTLSIEYASKNISVTGIAPHIIDTPANREWAGNTDYDQWQKSPEIGELVHFIFSNYHYLSGNIIMLQRRFKR
jgi:NAD(P)-dependent dehydrogenase (short-subunit alcohol dehydrogenase family)